MRSLHVIRGTRLCKVFASLAVCAFASHCSAATVLSNNLSNVQQNYDLIRNPTTRAVAFKTDSSSYTDITATLLMSRETAQDLATVVLYADSNSTIGSILGTFTPPASFSTGSTAVQQPASFTLLGVTLAPNTQYWVGLQAVGTSTLRWAWTNDATGTGAGFTGNDARSNDSGATWLYFNMAAPNMAQISATPVPEPTAVCLALLGGAALVL